MQEIKEALYQLCLVFAENRIKTAQTALQLAQESSNDDTKSSAGDKYETGREMMQQEINRNKKLLEDAGNQLVALKALNPAETASVARNGSLVYTTEGNFYISISAGLLKYNSQSYYAVSAASPIGAALLGKKTGDAFSFNGKTYQVEGVV